MAILCSKGSEAEPPHKFYKPTFGRKYNVCQKINYITNIVYKPQQSSWWGMATSTNVTGSIRTSCFQSNWFTLYFMKFSIALNLRERERERERLDINMINLQVCCHTVKHLSFMRTSFLRKFARTYRCIRKYNNLGGSSSEAFWSVVQLLHFYQTFHSLSKDRKHQSFGYQGYIFVTNINNRDYYVNQGIFL